MNRLLRGGAALLAALSCSSCMVGPDYRAPERTLPASWNAPPDETIAARPEAGSDAAWWKLLADPLLDSLIERAVASNTDVRRAIAQVRAARASRQQASSALFPSANTTVAYERRQPAGTEPRIPTDTPEDTRGPREFDEYTVGFDASWEIDLFGGLRRARQQATAELEARGADLRGVLVSVQAELARNYVEARSLQRRIAIAEDNALSQKETLDLARWRFQAGLVGALDVDQAEYNLAETRSRVPALQSDLSAARNRVSVLSGRDAGSLDADLESIRPVPVPPEKIEIGVPVDLLRRRPDIAAAERRLEAATAAVGVATSDLYPKLTLNGTFNVAATDISHLDASAARGFGVGPSLRWNVFDAGRLRSVVAQRSAEADSALADWENRVLGALEEADNALVAYVRERQRRDRLREARSSATRAHDLARLQYENGLVDFQRVLEAQRAALVFEESLAISDATVTTDLIALYKALGGGWQAVGCDDTNGCHQLAASQ